MKEKSNNSMMTASTSAGLELKNYHSIVYPNYSEKLLFLGFPWGITAPVAMLLLALMFRKKNKQQ